MKWVFIEGEERTGKSSESGTRTRLHADVVGPCKHARSLHTHVLASGLQQREGMTISNRNTIHPHQSKVRTRPPQNFH